jgi:hypothetical protein
MNTDTPETDAFLKEYYPEHPTAGWVRTQLGVTFEGPLEQMLKKLERERNKYREAILATLEENRHLADGEDCTLAKLKSAIPDWK